MVIHIMDAQEMPAMGDKVTVNCGEKVGFFPVDARWDDGRICEECRRLHSQPPAVSSDRTFALAAAAVDR